MRTERHDNEDGSYFVAAIDEQGRVIAVVEYSKDGRWLREHLSGAHSEPQESQLERSPRPAR